MSVFSRSRKPVDRSERISFSEYLSSFSGPIVFFLVIVAMIFVMSVFFRISDISVEGNVHYTDSEIIQAIDIEEGDNIFFFDRFAALSRVFAKLPYIEEVAIERSLPNKVKITVSESEALAYIVLGDEYWTIDHSCKILGNELVAYISEVLYQLEERGLNRMVGSVDFSNKNHVEFTYGDKYTVRIGDAAYTEHKFAMFVSVLSQLLPGYVGIIDLSDANTAHFIPN